MIELTDTIKYFGDPPYRMISDIVPYEFMLKAVENCSDKELCKLYVEQGETTTAGDRQSYYNSLGRLIMEDRNNMTVYVNCVKCKKIFVVSGSIK